MKILQCVSTLIRLGCSALVTFLLVLGGTWAFGFISAVVDGGSNPGNPITLVELRVRQNLSDHNSIIRHGYKTYVNIVSEMAK